MEDVLDFTKILQPLVFSLISWADPTLFYAASTPRLALAVEASPTLNPRE
jgi:hypothetical protein